MTLCQAGVEIRDIEHVGHQSRHRSGAGLQAVCHLRDLCAQGGVFRSAANRIGHQVDGMQRIAYVMGDGIQQSCLSLACLVCLEATESQFLVLTSDLCFSIHQLNIGGFQAVVLLLEQFGLGFADIQRRHPEVEQAGNDQQRDRSEHAIDESGFTQREFAGRYLLRIGDERRKRECDCERPQQAPIASERNDHERDAVDRRDVEIDPGREVQDDFDRRNCDRQNICQEADPSGMGVRRGHRYPRFDGSFAPTFRWPVPDSRVRPWDVAWNGAIRTAAAGLPRQTREVHHRLNEAARQSVPRRFPCRSTASAHSRNAARRSRIECGVRTRLGRPSARRRQALGRSDALRGIVNWRTGRP